MSLSNFRGIFSILFVEFEADFVEKLRKNGENEIFS